MPYDLGSGRGPSRISIRGPLALFELLSCAHAELWKISSIGREIMTSGVWVAVALMVAGAAFLVTGLGAPGLWIAVIAVGIALVIIDRRRGRHSLGS